MTNIGLHKNWSDIVSVQGHPCSKFKILWLHLKTRKLYGVRELEYKDLLLNHDSSTWRRSHVFSIGAAKCFAGRQRLIDCIRGFNRLGVWMFNQGEEHIG